MVYCLYFFQCIVLKLSIHSIYFQTFILSERKWELLLLYYLSHAVSSSFVSVLYISLWNTVVYVSQGGSGCCHGDPWYDVLPHLTDWRAERFEAVRTWTHQNMHRQKHISVRFIYEITTEYWRNYIFTHLIMPILILIFKGNFFEYNLDFHSIR